MSSADPLGGCPGRWWCRCDRSRRHRSQYPQNTAGLTSTRLPAGTTPRGPGSTTEPVISCPSTLGVRNRRILWHRVFPNSLTPLVVQATLGIATAVLEVAALSFLGLGVQPPTAEWGSMLAAERNNVFTAFFLVLFPGIMIMINVLAFNLLGDGLRDALDPRLNR